MRSAGIHHITAMAGDPQLNLDFYTETLGLRLVKRTVNFDDPNTWHLYYGNETGAPGTALTFFIWEHATAGRSGVGQAVETAFAIPESSIGYWASRLVDKSVLKSQTVPRVRLTQMWRVNEPFLEQAQDDATLIAIRDMERAGIDIITDGEMRRESYSNRFATALEGIDLDNPGSTISRSGVPIPVPRVVGRISRRHPVEIRDVKFLRANTDRLIKMTVPGPFTMTQQAEDGFYGDEEAMAMDYAAAVNAEIKDLFASGADVVQIDEPYMQAHPAEARSYGVPALQRALDGITGTTVVHVCFGYGAMVKGKPARYDFLAELVMGDEDAARFEVAMHDSA